MRYNYNMNGVGERGRTYPEWGTRHTAGCYYGSGLYRIWYAVNGCREEHVAEDSLPFKPGSDGVLWGDSCWRCGFPQGEPHTLRITGQGCYAGALGDILTALESPEDKDHRRRVAQMIREGEGLCIIPRCALPRYAWGPTSMYCVQHEPEHAPKTAAERAGAW